MSYFLFLALIVVLAVVNAAHVHMERALIEDRTDFVMGNRADPSQLHEVTFAVKQNNLDALDKYLMEVSDPDSPKYGQFLTRSEVGTITSNPEAVNFVESYLSKNGATVVKKTLFGEYITAKASISVWEKLFATTFFQFTHTENVVAPISRSLHYAVEEELSNHIYAVFETCQLPFVGKEFSHFPVRSDAEVGSSGTVTPAFINSYYNISSNVGSKLNSQSLFETSGQYMSPADLTQFQKNFNLPLEPIADDIGGYVEDGPCLENTDNCMEANLDVQYMMAIAQTSPTTYWYEGATDFFTAWIKAVASTPNPPLIHSMSYGVDEPKIPKSVASAFNTEAMKLGTQGVTIFVSSGDDGVASPQARKRPSKCGYSPSYPATSPYVTAVGATQGPESGKPEIACSSATGGVITTGGGFSVRYGAPSWQTSVIAGYFNSLTTQPVTGYATAGRGIPDLSLLGYNYEVVVGGKIYRVSGTSASSPALAGFFSLINSARLNSGKKPLGFINPSIYKFASKFANDITQGFNNCTAGPVCCSQGFEAMPGWDPLTGFGSVNFNKLYQVFYNL